MTSKLEIIPRQAVKHLFAAIDDLKALLERWRLSSNITSTDQKQPVGISLDVLEVVLKLILNVHSSLVQDFRLDVVQIHHFGVTFKNVHLFKDSARTN